MGDRDIRRRRVSSPSQGGHLFVCGELHSPYCEILLVVSELRTEVPARSAQSSKSSQTGEIVETRMIRSTGTSNRKRQGTSSRIGFKPYWAEVCSPRSLTTAPSSHGFDHTWRLGEFELI
jgi:hypothetical protein